MRRVGEISKSDLHSGITELLASIPQKLVGAYVSVDCNSFYTPSGSSKSNG